MILILAHKIGHTVACDLPSRKKKTGVEKDL